MTFTVGLELLQKYKLRNKLSDLPLFPYAKSSSAAHPSSILRKYLIPINTRLQLTIRKDNDEKELSGSICLIRINHLEGNCKSAFHRRPALCFGKTEDTDEYLSFQNNGSFLCGSRLNKIQIALPEGSVNARECCCSLSLHVIGTLNEEDIDLTLHAAITQGRKLSINELSNPIDNSKKNENFTPRMLYFYCRCHYSSLIPGYHPPSERQKYLYSLSKKFP